LRGASADVGIRRYVCCAALSVSTSRKAFCAGIRRDSATVVSKGHAGLSGSIADATVFLFDELGMVRMAGLTGAVRAARVDGLVGKTE